MKAYNNVSFLTTHYRFFSHQYGSSTRKQDTVWYSGYSWVHFFLANIYVNCPRDLSPLQTPTSYLCCTTDCSVTQIMYASNAPSRWCTSPSRHCFIIRPLSCVFLENQTHQSDLVCLIPMRYTQTGHVASQQPSRPALVFPVSPCGYNEAGNRLFNHESKYQQGSWFLCWHTNDTLSRGAALSPLQLSALCWLCLFCAKVLRFSLHKASSCWRGAWENTFNARTHLLWATPPAFCPAMHVPCLSALVWQQQQITTHSTD